MTLWRVNLVAAWTGRPPLLPPLATATVAWMGRDDEPRFPGYPDAAAEDEVPFPIAVRLQVICGRSTYLPPFSLSLSLSLSLSPLPISRGRIPFFDSCHSLAGRAAGGEAWDVPGKGGVRAANEIRVMERSMTVAGSRSPPREFFAY